MSARRAAWVAWGGVAVYVVLTTVGLALQLRAPAVELPGDEESVGSLEVAFGLVLLVFTLVGALVASRRPSHPVGWILLAIGVLYALTAFTRVALAEGSAAVSRTAATRLAWGSWVSTVALLAFAITSARSPPLPAHRTRTASGALRRALCSSWRLRPSGHS